MHELLLLGQVPANRQAQVLGVLSGLTAAQPHRVVERHVLFRPLRNAPSEGPQKGGTQVIAANKSTQSAAGKELFHLRLVKKVVEADFGRGVGDGGSSKTVSSDGSSKTMSDEGSPKKAVSEGWEMVFRDIPEPGKRSASLRMVQHIPIQGDNPMRFMELQGYKHQYEYVVEGHRFVYNNVVLFLHRMLRYPEPGPTILDGVLPSFDMLKPLDPSGAYLFQASVLLADGANPAIVNLGLSEIDAAKKRLKGVVNLDIPDRLALDTRVK